MSDDKPKNEVISHMVIQRLKTGFQWIVYSHLLEKIHNKHLDSSAEDFLQICIQDRMFPPEITNFDSFRDNRNFNILPFETHLAELQLMHRQLKDWNINDDRELLIRHIFPYLNSKFEKLSSYCKRNAPLLDNTNLSFTATTRSDLEAEIGVLKVNIESGMENILGSSSSSSGKSTSNNFPKLKEPNDIDVECTTIPDVSVDTEVSGEQLIKTVNSSLSLDLQADQNDDLVYTSFSAKMTRKSPKKRKQIDKAYRAGTSVVRESQLYMILRRKSVSTASNVTHTVENLITDAGNSVPEEIIENEPSVSQNNDNKIMPSVILEPSETDDSHEIVIQHDNTPSHSTECSFLKEFQDLIEDQQLEQADKVNRLKKLKLLVDEKITLFDTAIYEMETKRSSTLNVMLHFSSRDSL